MIRRALRTFPARIAELGFDVELPEDWVAHPLPAEPVDFDQPAALVPLAVVTPSHAAIVFSCAGRPAYEDGALHDWAHYLLQANGLTPRTVGASVVAGVPAAIGEATQDSEVGTLVVRFAFFEDGGRFVNLSLTAPELLADAVRDVWFAALHSFRLAAPRGSRFALDGTEQQMPKPATAAAEPAADAASEAPTAPETLPEPEASPEPETADEPSTPPETPVRRFAEFALAADTASLDPEAPMNQRLRDRGAGLVPDVVQADDEQRFAVVGAGSILARFAVPYGWHVIDDGRRALVFEPTGRVQIHLDRIAREGRDDDAVLDAIEAGMQSEFEAPEFVRFTADGMRALGARNLFDGEQPLEQYHLLVPTAAAGTVLRARVTATPEMAHDAGDLAGLLLGTLDFGATPRDAGQDVGASPESPEWWRRAVALEAQDRCAEAEQLIRSTLQHFGCDLSLAELFRLRMRRLLAAGDRDGARDAFARAEQAMFSYASGATSGGEGAARSMERDDFRAQLVAEFGSDPDRASA